MLRLSQSNLSQVISLLLWFVPNMACLILRALLSIQAERGSEFAAACDRDRMAQWLSMLTRELQYKQEVYYRATSLLDAFLSSRKASRLVVCVFTSLALHLWSLTTLVILVCTNPVMYAIPLQLFPLVISSIEYMRNSSCKFKVFLSAEKKL